MSNVVTTRYTSVAIILHWVMAIAFLVMLGSGVTMSYIDIPQSLKFNMYQWHKSLGVILLCAFFLRIVWRLLHKPPRMPESIHGMERVLAHAGHWGLYALMFALPFSGWLMVSSSVYGLPTIVFGWFQWPHIPGIAANKAWSSFAKGAHFWLAIAFGLLILGHVGAVIKHRICENENLLPRMWWRVSMLAVLAVLVGVTGASAAPYQVDTKTSAITFSGHHAGNAFTGNFATWTADIDFDAQDLAKSHIKAVIDTKSAKTGNAMYDGTLPQGDWFDVGQYPQAVFEASGMRLEKDGAYIADGQLTIRDVTHPLALRFELTEQGEGRVKATATASIDRLQYGIGKQSDPKAEWVDKDIVLTITLDAVKTTP